MGETCRAPAAAACRTASSSWAGESDRYGTTGPMSTPQPRPRSFSAAHASSRRAGAGVPGSIDRHRSLSVKPADTFSPTSVTSAAAASRSMSRRISVPLVRIENGLAASVSAPMMPGISW